LTAKRTSYPKERSRERPLKDVVREKAKQHIIEKAADRFEIDGYRATSVRSIAKAAGTTHTTFYKFFDSKFDLILEAGRQTIPDLEELFRELAEVDLSKPNDIGRWVNRHLAVWKKRRSVFEAFCEASYGDAGVSAELYRHVWHLAAVYLNKGEDSRDVGQLREAALIVLSLSAMFSLVSRIPDDGERECLMTATANVLRRVLAGLED
jgi:AcrR family transcriptional regulator